jgi:hypothetical protein
MRALNLFSALLVRLRPTLFGYQLLFVLTRKS